jgi:hypothetical protein
MRSLQDEIRQAQKDLSCPICARTFQLRDIRIRSFHGLGSAELSVICSRGHFPVILLVPVTLRDAISAGPITDQEVKQFSLRISKADKSIKEVL